LTFVLSLAVARHLPGGIARCIKKDGCSATAVLTNLGEPLARIPLPKQQRRLVVGSAILEEIDVLAPLRPSTCAAFAACHYAGRLRITLHYDPRPLTALQAQDLLDTYFHHLRRTIARE
jgi:hypothetical protein